MTEQRSIDKIPLENTEIRQPENARCFGVKWVGMIPFYGVASVAFFSVGFVGLLGCAECADQIPFTYTTLICFAAFL